MAVSMEERMVAMMVACMVEMKENLTVALMVVQWAVE